jgi:hypothetical protein
MGKARREARTELRELVIRKQTEDAGNEQRPVISDRSAVLADH